MFPEKFPSFQVQKPIEAGQLEQKNSLIFEKQKMLLSKVAEQVNASVERYGVKGLVDADGRIVSENFALEKGGIYEEEKIAEDSAKVRIEEQKYSGSYTERVQERYRKEFGIEGEEAILEHYRQEKEKSKSNQVEMITIALLHKVLRNRFLVVRASKFDDYKHGVDYLVLDKETGATICAFDGVLKNERDEGRPSSKLAKIHDKAEHGGAEVTYGIAMRDERLVRSHVQHKPLFYLTIESSDIKRLTHSLVDNFDGAISDVEREIFTKLVESIDEQRDILDQLSLPNHVKREMDEIPVLLEAFQECCATK
ncbi:MAG: hypothetical protein PHT88_00045 [Candidatus Moranbacteria bacterium]|nr:hypothetical protein [Candidatus Moranbacteria bacterium]